MTGSARIIEEHRSVDVCVGTLGHKRMYEVMRVQYDRSFLLVSIAVIS